MIFAGLLGYPLISGAILYVLRRMKRGKVIFRWYDLYVGLYYDRKECHLYIFPIPCVGVRFNVKGLVE